jgi:hypothetical protein
MEGSHYEEVPGVTKEASIGHGLRTGIELYEIESPVVPQ